MKTIKIMFVSWHFPTNEQLLKAYIKMTPKCSGKWKNIEATLNPNEADYFIVIGGYKGKFDPKRALYFGQHGITSPSFKDFKNVECLASFPLSKYLNPGEIWIDYTYDELVKLKPPKKQYNLCCITTYQEHYKWYTDRIRFMEHLAPKYPQVHLYGRPSNKFIENSILKNCYKGFLGRDDNKVPVHCYESGKNILLNYRYSLEFDQGKTINCINERFYDAMLLWCMPIYFGAINVEDFFPINSFRYVDISQKDLTEEIKKVIETVKSDFREKHIKEMAQTRDLILDKYHTFAYVHNIISNLNKYIRRK